MAVYTFFVLCEVVTDLLDHQYSLCHVKPICSFFVNAFGSRSSCTTVIDCIYSWPENIADIHEQETLILKRVGFIQDSPLNLYVEKEKWCQINELQKPLKSTKVRNGFWRLQWIVLSSVVICYTLSRHKWREGRLLVACSYVCMTPTFLQIAWRQWSFNTSIKLALLYTNFSRPSLLANFFSETVH